MYVFSQVPFPSLAFTSPADKVDEHVGGKEWGLHAVQAGPASRELEAFSECWRHSHRDSWVEGSSLDKPQHP